MLLSNLIQASPGCLGYFPQTLAVSRLLPLFNINSVDKSG
jgi:hypothetical protein